MHMRSSTSHEWACSWAPAWAVCRCLLCFCQHYFPYLTFGCARTRQCMPALQQPLCHCMNLAGLMHGVVCETGVPIAAARCSRTACRIWWRKATARSAPSSSPTPSPTCALCHKPKSLSIDATSRYNSGVDNRVGDLAPRVGIAGKRSRHSTCNATKGVELHCRGGALVGMEYGFMGPNYSISTACATANYCFVTAANHIRRGDADVILAGGSEAPIIPVGLGGFVACR